MIITARSWVVPADYFAANAEVTEGITRAFGGIGVKAPAVRVITDKYPSKEEVHDTSSFFYHGA